MVTGFAFSPGGLMLPYHVGALASLEYNGYLTDANPIAGSSAGSIAVSSFAAGIKPERVLESTIQVSDECQSLGITAQGNLLPMVRRLADELIQNNNFEQLREREGATGICYQELLPRYQSILEIKFDTKQDLIQAISNSCMFPFFSTKFPCAIDSASSRSKTFPRLVVDGFFAVPRDRFGCPDFDMLNDSTEGGGGAIVDRTVSICCFPHEKMRMTASAPEDQISPPETEPLGKLFEIATQATSRKDLTYAYELGWENADAWCQRENAIRKGES
jgi:hypothetical protein